MQIAQPGRIPLPGVLAIETSKTVSDAAIPAIILAGGKAKPDLAAATGVENRALIPFRGRPMLSYVVEALAASDTVGNITVVGDVADSAAYARVADSGGFVENLFAGLRATGSSSYALVATADIPFITAESVDDFVRNGTLEGADLVYPIVRVAECYRRFPGIRRTAASLREGRFTGGNLTLMRTDFMLAQHDRIARAYSARKSPLRLALMLGLGTTLRAALALSVLPAALSVSRLESAVGGLLGGTARAYESAYPEIATDIDRAEDVLKAEG